MSARLCSYEKKVLELSIRVLEIDRVYLIEFVLLLLGFENHWDFVFGASGRGCVIRGLRL